MENIDYKKMNLALFEAKTRPAKTDDSSKRPESGDTSSSDKTSTDGSTPADDKKEKLADKLKKMIINIVKNYVADKAGDLIDELLLGNFKDALIDIYRKEKSKMTPDEIKTAFSDLEKTSAYQRGKKYAELDNRKDDNQSTNVDEGSVKKDIWWAGKNEATNVAKTLSNLVADFQKSMVEMQRTQEEMKKKLKDMGVQLSDKEFATFGPQLAKSIDSGDAEKVRSELQRLKSKLHESYMRKFNRLKLQTMLTESKFVLTEDVHYEMLYSSLLESEEYRDAILQIALDEGMKEWFGRAGVALLNLGGKAVQLLSKSGISAMLRIGSFATSILTGGWAAAAVLKLIYCVEKHGKELRNGLELMTTKIANSKGVIAKATFNIDGDDNKEYSMRFYEKELVWRVLNVSNQLKHPGIEYAKAIVNGKFGQKFRNEIKHVWDPLFNQNKGGQIDWNAIFKQTKNVKLPEKALAEFRNFQENYSKIRENCIEQPKISTRTQKLKSSNTDVKLIK